MKEILFPSDLPARLGAQNGEKMDIQVLIRKLVSYGVQTGLVPEEDVIYTTNRLLELFELDELEEEEYSFLEISLTVP